MADTTATTADGAVTPFTLPGWDARLRGFHCGDEVDCFALVTTRYLIFCDTSATTEQAAAIVASLTAELRGRLPLVILSHADYDHCWGNAVFAPDGALPATIIGHALTRERLLSQEALTELAEKRRIEPRFASVRLVAPDIAFTERLEVAGGDLSLELLHASGHTPDHSVIWIPTLRLLLAGDAVERPFPYVHSGAALPTLRATLARLEAMDAESIAVCHGAIADPALIGRNIAYFDEVERRCRAALTHSPTLAGRAQTDANDADEETSEGVNEATEALEQAVAFPYAEALRLAETPPDAAQAFYRRFHRAAIRATLAWLGA